MNLKYMLDLGAYAPVRAHKYDAGWDLRMPYDPYSFHHEYSIEPHKSLCINTGIHVQIPEGYVGFLKSKSGLNVTSGITSGEGVIDAGYTGPIVVKLVNNSDDTFRFKTGQKISQLVVLPILQFEEAEPVECFEETERGDNGFGSTGR